MMEKMHRFIPALILLFLFVAGIGWQLGKANRKSFDFPYILGEEVVAPTVVPVPPITLSNIFSSDHSLVDKLPQDKVVTMIATGDVIPARSVNYKMATGHGFRWPFEKTAEVLASADLTVINLETPLLTACPITVEGMLFCGDAKAAEGLVYAGVDVATLGNNHVGNHFLEGIQETRKILDGAGIMSVSEGISYKEVRGITFAFLAYNDIGAPEAGVPWADEQKIKEDVAQARKNADVVVVAYHWGTEYVTMPTGRQRELAHLTVDSGADVVLGNHPHWIQPVELYKGKYIIYAHGNFVFDQEWSAETKLGVVGKYVFYEGNLVDVVYMPVKIMDYGQPYFLEGAEAKKVLDAMEQASVKLMQ